MNKSQRIVIVEGDMDSLRENVLRAKKERNLTYADFDGVDGKSPAALEKSLRAGTIRAITLKKMLDKMDIKLAFIGYDEVEKKEKTKRKKSSPESDDTHEQDNKK